MEIEFTTESFSKETLLSMVDGENNDDYLKNKIFDIDSNNFRIVFDLQGLSEPDDLVGPTIFYSYKICDDKNNLWDISVEKFLMELFPQKYQGNGAFSIENP